MKAATFENLAPKGLVSDELVEFHRRVAAGGVGMTTLAYVSASPEGRTHRDQLVMVPEAIPGLPRPCGPDVVRTVGRWALGASC